ncbi:MAG TPA: phosphoglucosamine mutase [Acidimicrobiia bacterium]|nr:phosphoglucosamine mutase [Acidimicrobiia bacterium]
MVSLLDSGQRLFGTDGVRGVANLELTPELATAIGRSAGLQIKLGPVVVGRDTRRSGEMLSLALQAGFHSAGIDTLDVGVLPSGGISYLTHEMGAQMGAVVSASHNPAPDNGIKLLSSLGTKLTDEEEDQIEARIRSSSQRIPTGHLVGTRFSDGASFDRYLDFLAATARYSYRGMAVAVDAANGAAYKAAPALFRKLRASVEEWAVEPDGNNINLGCGSTHPEFLSERAVGRIGLAFDGDADRLLAFDEDGHPLNGDVIMAIIARHMKAQGQLRGNLVVATVMSNLGFRKAMAECGIELIETKVGDRYVLEAMRERKAILGGEQSGHIIFLDRGRTGDGLLTAVRLLDVVAGTGKELRQLRAEAMIEYPQVLRNVPVGRGSRLEDAAEVWAETREVERELGAEGRVLVRASGTEPLVRVMVEAPSQEAASGYADRLAQVVGAALGAASAPGLTRERS